MRRHPLGQRAIRRHQRRRPPRLLQRLPQRQRDPLCLLRRGRDFQHAHPRQPPLACGQVAPQGRALGRHHRARNRLAARGRRIQLGRDAPALELAALHAHPVDQQLQMELWMRLQAALAPSAHRVRRERPQHRPFLVRHRQIDARQHHLSLRQSRDDTQQPRNRGRARGNPRRADKPLGRRRRPPRRDPVEQAVAPLGQIDPA